MFKWLIAIVAITFVSWRIYDYSANNTLIEFNWSDQAGFLIGLSFFLGFVNWSTEAIKWKLLLKGIVMLKFIQAFKQVMQGVTTAILTPNRIGSFIGRVGDLEKKDRSKGILLTLLAGFAQFSVTVGFGIVGWIIIYKNEELPFQNLILTCSILLIIMGILIFFKPALVLRKPFLSLLKDKTIESIEFVEATPNRLRLIIIGLSIIRFLVFSLQYMLILMAFNTSNTALLIWFYVIAVYGLMTVLPGLLFGKLFVREAAALIVFPMLGFADNAIILAGIILWFINIGLPALVGAILLAGNKKWFNQKPTQL
ncbi:MAG: hypothetical protein ACPG21_05055 [Crocinitomicaceae bacterium]